MIQMRKVLYSSSLLLGLLILILVAFSCDDDNLTDTDYIWYVDNNGKFYTTDIERAQKEVNFKIIVPSYLPDGMVDAPLVKGPQGAQSPDNKVELKIEYHQSKGSSAKSIYITELNYSVFPPESGCKATEIGGLQCVEGEADMASYLPDGGQIPIHGTAFWCNKNGIYLEIAVYGYDRSEAVKVVESIIEQIE